MSNNNGFVPTLKKTIDDLGITANALAVQARVRPLTIYDLCKGKSRQISLATLNDVILALNYFSQKKGVKKKHSVSDILEHVEAVD